MRNFSFFRGLLFALTLLPGVCPQTLGAFANATASTVADLPGNPVPSQTTAILAAWGNNSLGGLGNGGHTSINAPYPVNVKGVLSGKTIRSLAAGDRYSVALCTDGTLATWGKGTEGELGNGANANSALPVLVERSGALNGRTVTAVAAGYHHCVVLCSDGNLAAWGRGLSGALGNGLSVNSDVPVLVNRAGVLRGKFVTALACGGNHSLALCSDGTVVAWGANESGQLGIGVHNFTSSNLPIRVYTGGVLQGRKVTHIAAGYAHSLASGSDSTMVSWGLNDSGQLGNRTNITSGVPVYVDLFGVPVVSLSAGRDFSVALTKYGQVKAWGGNQFGQLGSQTNSNSNFPVSNSKFAGFGGSPPDLFRWTAIAISSSEYTTVAVDADGSVWAWGYGLDGELGNGSNSNSSYPVQVGSTGPLANQSPVSIACGAEHSLVMRGNSQPQAVANSVSPPLTKVGNSATIRTDFRDQNGATDMTIVAVKVQGSTSSSKSLTAYYDTTTNLLYLLNDAGTGLLGGFAPWSDHVITNSQGSLSCRETWIDSPYTDRTIYWRLTPTLALAGTDHISQFAQDAAKAQSGWTDLGTIWNITAEVPPVLGELQPSVGSSAVLAPLVVTSTYSDANGLPDISQARLLINGTNSTKSALCAAYDPYGNALYLYGDDGTTLLGGFEPGSPNVISNSQGSLDCAATSVGLTTPTDISLTWSFLPKPAFKGAKNVYLQAVDASNMQAGYDLKGSWTVTTPAGGPGIPPSGAPYVAAWGYRGSGPTSNNPILVSKASALRNKNIAKVAGGDDVTVALLTDGTLATWGSNLYGQLGTSQPVAFGVPIEVDQRGVLAGKTVIDVAAGGKHCLALCSDGSIASWGDNYYGELGSGSSDYTSFVPVLVDRSGALAGKTVVAVAAGSGHNLALCKDGTLVAWGSNLSGQLGYVGPNSLVPVVVAKTGALAGKTIVAISAGQNHNAVLCSDGSIMTWGENSLGQLGNGSSATSSPTPVAVYQAGVLAGKSVTAVDCGLNYTLALCSDGNIAAWGEGSQGILGNGSGMKSATPVLAIRSAEMTGKTVIQVQAGWLNSLALCSDGSVFTWGLPPANNSYYPAYQPVLIYTYSCLTGRKVTGIAAGEGFDLALFGSVPPLAVSVTPVATSSPVLKARTFSALYRDADGAEDITVARLLINDTPNQANGISVYYDRLANKLYLYNDAGTGLLGGYAPGSATFITNSKGTLNCATTSVTSNGTDLTVNWTIIPKATFTGTHQLYGFVSDTTLAFSDWPDLGNWSVFSNVPPTNTSVTPASGTTATGTPLTFSAVYSDANGAADITAARFVMGANFSNAHGLCARYDAVGGKVYLYADDGVTLLGGFAPGTSNTISNSQGTLNCAQFSVTRVGNDLTVNWNFTPGPQFLGPTVLYLLGQDASGTVSGWDQEATHTFTKPDATPAASFKAS